MPDWIDTHAHLYSDEFKADQIDTIARARQAGLTKIFLPNIDHASIDAMLELEEKNKEYCAAMMGLHPCSVKKDFEKELYIVESWLARRKFAAIGEMGTDLYWDKTFWEQQKEAFSIQVRWAKQYSLPVVLHSRESIDETIHLLEPHLDGKIKGVFHCFGGTLAQAKRITEMGFYLSLGGVATFKKSGLEEVIPFLELENIVLETDCPYLAPVPYRGKRNEPSYIPLIAQKICELKKITLGELASITTTNANRLFAPSPHT
jgi:TatD DNase family protein